MSSVERSWSWWRNSATPSRSSRSNAGRDQVGEVVYSCTVVTYTLHLTACGQSESVPILFVDSLHAQTQSSYVIT